MIRLRPWPRLRFASGSTSACAGAVAQFLGTQRPSLVELALGELGAVGKALVVEEVQEGEFGAVVALGRDFDDGVQARLLWRSRRTRGVYGRTTIGRGERLVHSGPA